MHFLIFFFVLSLVYGYTGLRVIPFLTSDLYIRAFFSLVWVFGFASVPLYFYIKFHGKSSWTIDAMAWVGYTGLGIVSLLFFFFVVKDAGQLTLKGIVNVMRIFGNEPFSMGPESPERRRFILSSVHLGVVGIVLLLTGYGFYKAMLIPKIKKVKLKLGHLHPSLSKLKIVQITDVHIGPTIKGDFLKEVVRKINSIEPDIVAITGDLVDGPVRELKKYISELKNIKAKVGVYFVTGNHEYYSGAESWVRYLSSLGIKVLMNEHQMLNVKGINIALAGVTDHATAKGADVSDPHKAIKNMWGDPHLKILLAHQPNSAFEAAEAGYHLQLSGHTHGGQYFPSTWLIKFFQTFVAGLYTHKGMLLYVSKGTGYWGPPLRLNADSEITEFEFV